MTHKVFIDGEAGTTGLQIRDRLANLSNVEVLSIEPEKRKDPLARQALMRAADVIILCLPDDAAREAVALAGALGDDAPRIIDASTAHRTHEGWAYGFPELAPGHAKTISNAARVANPGCYSTGAIALIRPLRDAGVIADDYPITVNAVSGYTGGGKSMIADYESGNAPPFLLYGLGLDHKHLPELTAHAKLKRQPILVPSVGNFAQGMLVSVPLYLNGTTVAGLHDIYAKYYAEAGSAVRLAPYESDANKIVIDDTTINDQMTLHVFGRDDLNQAVVAARLDNLGKGAAGAAVQNLKLMLGLSA